VGAKKLRFNEELFSIHFSFTFTQKWWLMSHHFFFSTLAQHQLKRQIEAGSRANANPRALNTP
jgi:hypothetical protein